MGIRAADCDPAAAPASERVWRNGCRGYQWKLRRSQSARDCEQTNRDSIAIACRKTAAHLQDLQRCPDTRAAREGRSFARTHAWPHRKSSGQVGTLDRLVRSEHSVKTTSRKV